MWSDGRGVGVDREIPTAEGGLLFGGKPRNAFLWIEFIILLYSTDDRQPVIRVEIELLYMHMLHV